MDEEQTTPTPSPPVARRPVGIEAMAAALTLADDSVPGGGGNGSGGAARPKPKEKKRRSRPKKRTWVDPPARDHVGRYVQLHGLHNAALNGKIGIIVAAPADAQPDRVGVQLPGRPQPLHLHSSLLRPHICEGTAVRLHGLPDAWIDLEGRGAVVTEGPQTDADGITKYQVRAHTQTGYEVYVTVASHQLQEVWIGRVRLAGSYVRARDAQIAAHHAATPSSLHFPLDDAVAGSDWLYGRRPTLPSKPVLAGLRVYFEGPEVERLVAVPAYQDAANAHIYEWVISFFQFACRWQVDPDSKHERLLPPDAQPRLWFVVLPHRGGYRLVAVVACVAAEHLIGVVPTTAAQTAVVEPAPRPPLVLTAASASSP